MPWFGNQYYDEKKMKWTSGKYKASRHVNWWWLTPIIFILFSILVTIAIQLVDPGTTISFFWF